MTNALPIDEATTLKSKSHTDNQNLEPPQDQ